MQKAIRARFDSLPRTEASFIEPMECLSVSKLPEGSNWVWEVLCGGPHKTSWTKPLARSWWRCNRVGLSGRARRCSR